MFGSIKTIWKIGMGVGAALIAGSVGGAVYDNVQAKKNVSLLDNDDFDDEVEIIEEVPEG